MMEKFNQIKELIASAEADVKKFYESKNNAAGTRVRKALQEMKALAQDMRNEITELKNQEKA
jgi:archaellum component FlaC